MCSVWLAPSFGDASNTILLLYYNNTTYGLFFNRQKPFEVITDDDGLSDRAHIFCNYGAICKFNGPRRTRRRPTGIYIAGDDEVWGAAVD